MSATVAKKVVQEYFKNLMPVEIKDLLYMAKYDLYYGPRIGGYYDFGRATEWPGYSKAIDTLQKWCDDNLYEVWYDDDSGEVFEPCCTEYDPQAYYYKFEGLALKRLIFGELVGNGL